MADNVAAENPDRTCCGCDSHRCPHMAEDHLEDTLASLRLTRWSSDVPRADRPAERRAPRADDRDRLSQEHERSDTADVLVVRLAGIAGGIAALELATAACRDPRHAVIDRSSGRNALWQAGIIYRNPEDIPSVSGRDPGARVRGTGQG